MDDGDEPPRGGTARSRAEDEPDGMTGAEDDFRALAEDWIAIWQSEITAYLTDPETQQGWSAMMAIWAGAAQVMMRGIPAAPHAYERHAKPPAPRQPRADAAAGAAPPAASPVARDDEIRRLEQRVAELERSLAEQERRRAGAGENRRTRRPVRPRG